MVLFLLPLLACVPDAKPSIDLDADGYTEADDCNDSNAAVNPGASESCNGVDDNCDGVVDEGTAADAGEFHVDADGDGHGAIGGAGVHACVPPDGYAASADDCNDADEGVFPGATEHCDGADEDCDEVVDEDAVDLTTFYADLDGDGFGSEASALDACEGSGVLVGGDCDDDDASANPDEAERCDGVDNDCDDSVDEGAADAPVWYLDADADGFGNEPIAACEQPEGASELDGDCDDELGTVYPGAPEACDGVDQNCDAELDDGFDSDADGTADCFDTELCDGLDNDGDGEVDEDDALDASAWFRDADEDTYGDITVTLTRCAQPTGYVADATDCDDLDAGNNPGADEVCDEEDDDCDGTVDEADAVDAPSWYLDSDGDGYGDASVVQCEAPAGYVALGGDCDESDPDRNPGEIDTCDGIDDNCSGDEADAEDAQVWYYDGDGDYYGDPDTSVSQCSAPSVYWIVDDTDCDDTLPDVNPGETEICNNLLDDDCDGGSNGCVLPSGGYANTVAEVYAVTGVENANCGARVAGAGDTDADGYDEFMCASTTFGGAGTTYVMSGSATPAGGAFNSAGTIFEGEVTSDRSGSAIGSAGDIDGDGDDEVLVAASYQGGSWAGTVYLIEGPLPAGTVSLSVANATIVGSDAYDAFGWDVASVDFNGDGFDDVVAGAPDQDDGGTDAGMVYVYTTTPSGALDATAAADVLLEGENTDDNAGWAVHRGGDVDGDGVADLVVGAPGSDSGSGAVYVVAGGVSGTIALRAADLRIGGDQAGDQAGYDVSGGGDIDGDGLDDIVIGAPGFRSSDDGIVYIVHGGATGTVDLGAGEYDGYILGGTGDELGTAVDIAGDVDGDGLADIAMTRAAYLDVVAEGQVSLAYGPIVAGDVTDGTWSASGYEIIGLDIAGVGDVNGDSYDDFLGGGYQRWDFSSNLGYSGYLFLGQGI